MLDILQKVTEDLDDALDDVRVSLAYSHKEIPQPIGQCAVYTTIDETCPTESFVNLKMFVYSPFMDDGTGCIRTAERVCSVLAGSKAFSAVNLKISECEWNKHSKAFSCTVTCSVTGGCVDSVQTVYQATANEFENDSELELRLVVSDIKTVKEYSPYLIMCYGEGVPKDVVSNAENFSYAITLYGVSAAAAEQLAGNGKFSLTLNYGGITEKYSGCVIKDSEINLNSVNRKNSVTVLSWKKEEQNG